MLKAPFIVALSLIAIPALSSANEPSSLQTGEKPYKSACIACHGTGAAGAPRFGNKQEWAPYLSQGLDQMVDVAMHGKGAMPARGGTKADDATLRAAVEYMASRAK